MGLPGELPSQIALNVGKRELQVRPSCFKPARSRFELARRFFCTGRSLIAVATAVVLAGCVTTSPVPSSPFLSAVAAAAAKASPSAMNANAAAATHDIATSSTSRPANAPSQDQPGAGQQNGSTGATGDAPVVAEAADRKGVYPQVARASENMAGAFATAGLRASIPAEVSTSSPHGRVEGKKEVTLSAAVAAAVMS